MKEERRVSLDLMRGLILILMAVDHASYFIGRVHFLEFWGFPSPDYGSSAAFFIRFCTHLCAPGFFLLLGAGMVLMAESRARLGWTEKRITGYFLKRGMILLLLQFFVENPAWLIGLITDRTGRATQQLIAGSGENIRLHFGVLFALGGSMIIWGFLRRLKSPAIFLLSLFFLVLSWILLPSAENASRLYSPLARILAIPGRTGIVQVYYPVIPWLGFAGLGLVLGRMIARRPRDAFRLSLAAGVFCLLFFDLVKILENSGNFFKSVNLSGNGFLRMTKYPPDPAFALFTLGSCLALLWLFSRLGRIFQNRRNPLLVFGRVPLFFYVSHLYFLAFAGFFFPYGAGHGIVFLVWFAVLAALYFLCRGYASFKFKKTPDSLWRFL